MCLNQGILRGDEKAKTDGSWCRHQQMVCLAAGDGTAIVDKDAILERGGRPHWPFCRSPWPSWGEKPLAFCQEMG